MEGSDENELYKNIEKKFDLFKTKTEILIKQNKF